jgi:hypothetical protein
MRTGTSIGMAAVGLILAVAAPFGRIPAAVGLLGLVAGVAMARRCVRRDAYPPDDRF